MESTSQGSTAQYEDELSRAHMRLQQQSELMQQYVQECKVLRLRLPADMQEVTKEERDGMDVTPQMMDPSVVSPLVAGYEGRMAELKALNTKLVNDKDMLRGQVRQLTEENEELRKRQLEDFDALLTKNVKRGMAGHMSGDEAMERVAELTERMQYLEEERDLLVKGKEMLTDELEQTGKVLSETEQRNFKLSEDLKELQFTRSYLDEVVAEKDVGAKKFVAQSAELGEARQQQRRAEETAQRLVADVAELSGIVEGHRVELRQKDKTNETQAEVLHEKVQTFAARIRDLQQKLAAKMAEAEASGQTVRAMNRDVEQLKTDNRGMIQLMNGMEKQLSEFAAREEQTDRLAHESKEMAERAVLERDQATATEAYLRQELARLRDVRVKEFEDRDRSHADALAAVKDDLGRQLKVKEQTLVKLYEENEHLRVNFDRANRERETSEDKLLQVNKTLETERRLISEGTEKLRLRIQEAETKERHSQQKVVEVKQGMAEESKRLSREGRDLERRRGELESATRSFDQERSSLEEARDAAVDGRARLERERTMLAGERDTLLAEKDALLLQAREYPARLSMLEDLKAKAKDLEMKYADLTAAKVREVDSLSRQLDFLKMDKTKQEGVLMEHLESRQRQLEAVTGAFHEKNIKCEELLAEVENLRVEAAEAEHAANEAHAEIGNFQQNITDLSIQLAESGSKEQQYIKEQARLKGEIARLRYSLPQS